MYWPQKFSRGSHFWLRSTENAGGWGNPFFAIGFNAKSATNFRSSSAMRGAEFHGNTRRDGPTAYAVYNHTLLVPGVKEAESEAILKNRVSCPLSH